MRVCLVAPALAPYHREGGIGQYVSMLANGLGERGHEVTVIGSGLHEYLQDVRVPEIFNEPYGRSIALPTWRIYGKWFGPRLYTFRAALAVASYVEANRDAFDLVEASNWLGYGAFLDRARLPTVVRVSTPAVEGWGSGPTLKLVNWLEGRSCRNASLVVGHSEAILQKAALLYRSWSRPSVVVPLAVEDVPATTVSPAEDHVDVLYLGRAEARKGTDLLLRALQIVLPATAKMSFTFVGTDLRHYLNDNSELRDVWENLRARFSTRLSDVGVVTVEEKDAAIARAHWLVVPSRFESFGLVIPEAMRAGTPVLVSAGGALPDVAALGPHNRIYGEPENVDALARALIELEILGSKAALATRRETRQAYLKHFTPPAFIESTLEQYDRLLWKGSAGVQ